MEIMSTSKAALGSFFCLLGDRDGSGSVSDYRVLPKQLRDACLEIFARFDGNLTVEPLHHYCCYSFFLYAIH
jgi:hypothetical protein